MNPICRTFGHWRKPFADKSLNFTTRGIQCRICGEVLSMKTTNHPHGAFKKPPKEQRP